MKILLPIPNSKTKIWCVLFCWIKMDVWKQLNLIKSWNKTKFYHWCTNCHSFIFLGKLTSQQFTVFLENIEVDQNQILPNFIQGKNVKVLSLSDTYFVIFFLFLIMWGLEKTGTSRFCKGKMSRLNKNGWIAMILKHVLYSTLRCSASYPPRLACLKLLKSS